MSSYEILLSSFQRRLIRAALLAMPVDVPERAALLNVFSSVVLSDDQVNMVVRALRALPNGFVLPFAYLPGEEEKELLIDLFCGLPEAERESPGCVHGFCL